MLPNQEAGPGSCAFEPQRAGGVRQLMNDPRPHRPPTAEKRDMSRSDAHERVRARREPSLAPETRQPPHSTSGEYRAPWKGGDPRVGSSREEPPLKHVGKNGGERKRGRRGRGGEGRGGDATRRAEGGGGGGVRKASTRLAPRLSNTSKEMCVSLEGAIGVSALAVWDERPRRRSAVPSHSLLPPRCCKEDVHVVNAAPAAGP